MSTLPVVLRKIKGFEIIEGNIEDDKFIEKCTITTRLPSNGFYRHR